VNDEVNFGSGPQGQLASGSDALSERTPVAMMLDGRGRVGKTVVAESLIQFCEERGATLRVWNGDLKNETHSLSTYHPDASRPPTDDAEEKRVWLEERLGEQARERFDTVLDMAGGDPTIRRLASDAQLVATMERQGLRPVAVHVLGPERADLDYLKQSMEGELFMPEATLIVCNGGLVQTGRSAKIVFEKVTKHEVVLAALDKGARIIWFPPLLCMSQVTDRGLTFRQVIKGEVKPGQDPLSFFDQARVSIFWEQLFPAALESVPSQWLPSMPDWKR